MAQTTPPSTPAAVCRLVALLCGHSARASPMVRREPYQYAVLAWPPHPEFVHAGGDDAVGQFAPPLLQAPVPTRQFVQRQDGIVTGVVGVVHRRPIDNPAFSPDGEVVGDRDGLAMGDQEAMVRAFEGRPAAHARAGTRAVEIDRGVTAMTVAMAIRRKVALVRAPAEFGWLAAFAGKAFDRPGIDELARPLGMVRHLGVALGDVNRLDTQPLRQCGPAGTITRLGIRVADRPRDVEQGLLDEVRHQAGIDAMRQDGRRLIARSAQCQG
jgi:hypothetical protein